MENKKNNNMGIGLSKILKPGEKNDGVSVVVMNNNILRYLKRLDRSMRLDMVFMRGIIGGLGSAIGATLVFAVLVFLMINIMKNVPFVDDLFDDLGIKEIVNGYVEEKDVNP